MEWKAYAEEIRELLELEGYPVAVTYALEAPPSSAGGKCRVCDAFLRARGGDVIDLTAASRRPVFIDNGLMIGYIIM